MDVEGPTTHGTFLVMCRSVPPADNWVGEYRTRPWEELDRFDRSSPAVDCVLLTVDQGSLCVLIHRRQNEPELGSWALPGSFVNPGPTYEAEVLRTLEKKAGLSFPEGPPYLEQLASWNQPNRDPRGWVITVAYLVLATAAGRSSMTGDWTRCCGVQLPAHRTEIVHLTWAFVHPPAS